MGIFTRKPYSVMASRWWKDGDHPDVLSTNGSRYGIAIKSKNDDEGLFVEPGDWVINDGGRLLVMSNDEFHKHYMPS